MGQHAAVVHLVGYPGVGKYTVATELAQLAEKRGQRFVVVDNHHMSNIILSVVPVDGARALPDTVWEHVGEVRAALIRAIEDLSPTDWSFVFTNVMVEGAVAYQQNLERVRQLAESRHSHYVPIRLSCHIEELLRRVVRPGRAERRKWADPAGVRAFVEDSELIRIAHPALLDIDVTHLAPRETAESILNHIDGLH